MTDQILAALANVLKDTDRLEHLQLHFSANDSLLRGSTFNSAVVENAFRLIQFISNKISQRDYKMKINANEVAIIIQSEKDHIGYDALMPIAELSDEELEEIKWTDRLGYQIQYLKKTPTRTHQMMAIFHQNEELELKTVFPGEYAPPFPNKTIQTEQEFSKSKIFWNQHVLLK